MPAAKTSYQNIKLVESNELDFLKSELKSKVEEINKILKSIQDKGLCVRVKNSTTVINDSLLTERFYSAVDINLSVQI